MLQLSLMALGGFGIVLVVAGAVYIIKGLQARAEITGELRYENATTGRETPAPGLPIVDARTAMMESALIKKHLFENSGQKRFTDLPRDDPQRDYILKGMTIRNALGLAVLGFGMADLAIVTGVLFVLVGLTFLGLSASLTQLIL